MNFEIDISDLRRAILDISDDLEVQATTAMRTATALAKQELRQQVTSAGLGARLANTWQDKVYPEKRRSLEPSGYVYSRAPEIIEPYLTGATIRPTGGRQYLWIPTKNVPRRRGRGPGKPMMPEEVEAKFNQDLIIRPAKTGGNLLAFISQERGLTKRGALRKVRKGRKGFGATAELVLMFTLIRSTTRPKKLDLEGAADRAAARFATLMGGGA